MTTRSVRPGAGFTWLLRSINLGTRNAAAIFGGGALFLAAVMLVAIVLSLVGTVVQTALGGSMASMLAFNLLLMVVLMPIMAGLMLGYLRLLHRVESGGSARPVDVFAGFSDTHTLIRMVGLIVVMSLAQNLIVFGLISMIAPDLMDWYQQILALSAQNPEQIDPSQIPMPPAGAPIAIMLVALIGLFGFAVQAIGMGQVALGGRGTFTALADGLGGALRNLLPLIVLALAAMVLFFALFFVLMIVMAIATLLGQLLGAWITMLIGLPLQLLVMLATFVVVLGVTYNLWRDICGPPLDGPGDPPPHQDQIEV